MNIDPAIPVVLGIFIFIVIVTKLIEKLLYLKDIRNLFSAFPGLDSGDGAQRYPAIVRVFKDDKLLFNKVRSNIPRAMQNRRYAFSYNVELSPNSITFIPRRLLSFKKLVLPFNAVDSLHYGSQDLGKFQFLETLGTVVGLPELQHKADKSDYYETLRAYLSDDPMQESVKKQFKDMLDGKKAVYVKIKAGSYTFLLNHQYKVGFGPTTNN